MENNQGRVEAESQPGMDLVFKIYFLKRTGPNTQEA